MCKQFENNGSVCKENSPGRLRDSDETVRVWKRFHPSPRGSLSGSVYSESSQYKLHLVQALKPYDRCKLYKVSYEFQVKPEEASVAAKLNFQLRCRTAPGWQNKPTTHLRLAFTKFLQAIRHKWDSKENIIQINQTYQMHLSLRFIARRLNTAQNVSGILMPIIRSL